MTPYQRSALDVAPASVVKHAARDFAALLADTEAFRNFEEATRRLRSDQDAQRAIQAYQEKRKFLHVLIMLNGLKPEEQAELDRLHQAMTGQPSVQGYFQAQARLIVLCRSLGDRLSGHIGIDYAAACGGGCCG